MMGLGGLGLIAVLAFQVRQNLFPPQPKTPNRCNMAVSLCLANCLLGDLAGQSGNVVLLFPPRRFMDADTEQSYEEGFVLPLRHSRGNLHLKALRLEGANRDAAHGLPRSNRRWLKLKTRSRWSLMPARQPASTRSSLPGNQE